jgi:hypothetical protein
VTALGDLPEGTPATPVRVGHAFTYDALSLEQDVALETSLFTALRAVEEKAIALRRLAERWPDRLPSVKQDYESRARELDGTAETLRNLLAGSPPRTGSIGRPHAAISRLAEVWRWSHDRAARRRARPPTTPWPSQCLTYECELAHESTRSRRCRFF